ncbi:heterokaryon incompatibility protein-domain-containing protein [Apiospora marii]|uniref:Heterokaryon incompatibility protein-domain-containing protein n=1 Tax=Apiospora marii TaxID=335849 RepID=A0ABR1RF15_9PEZI
MTATAARRPRGVERLQVLVPLRPLPGRLRAPRQRPDPLDRRAGLPDRVAAQQQLLLPPRGAVAVPDPDSRALIRGADGGPSPLGRDCVVNATGLGNYYTTRVAPDPTTTKTDRPSYFSGPALDFLSETLKYTIMLNFTGAWMERRQQQQNNDFDLDAYATGALRLGHAAAWSQMITTLVKPREPVPVRQAQAMVRAVTNGAAARISDPMEALADDEFRLLILLPGEFDEPLHCDLRTSTLVQHEPYEALSYVWGKNPSDVDIELAGQRVSITESLEAILFRLRLPSEPRTLWIDQLCIDQSNIEEKSAQVQKMRSIYINCTRAIIWLGEIADGIRRKDAEGAFAVIEYIATLGSENEAGTLQPEAGTLQPPQCMQSDESFEASMKALGTVSIVKGPWWHRVWTVQEAMLPNDLLYLWGPLSLSKNTTESATSVWVSSNLRKMAPKQLSTAMELGDMGHLMARFIWFNGWEEGLENPMDTMIKWRLRAATDPRDNVYALTGLHTAGTLLRSGKCDYSLDMEQVFINYTLDLIYRSGHNEHGDLLPLVIDPWGERSAELSGLPRWAIDMRSEPNYHTQPFRMLSTYDQYEANKGMPVARRPEYTGEGLSVSGVAVDIVEVAGDGVIIQTDGTGQTFRERPDPDIREKIISWWNIYSNANNRHLPIPIPTSTTTDCREYDEFCRLILGEILEDHQNATIEDRKNVSSYLETGKENHSLEHLHRQLRNRRFFITKKGHIGLGHLETMPGDDVWVLNHGRVPFTLRAKGDSAGPSAGNSDDYIFVGHCYSNILDALNRPFSTSISQYPSSSIHGGMSEDVLAVVPVAGPVLDPDGGGVAAAPVLAGAVAVARVGAAGRDQGASHRNLYETSQLTSLTCLLSGVSVYAHPSPAVSVTPNL